MRKFSWVILVINALFLIWVIAGAASSNAACDPKTQAACEAGQAIGKGIGVALIIVFWAVIDVILLVIWLVTKKKDAPTIVYIEKPAEPAA